MKENIKGQPGNRKPDGRKVQSPNKKPNPVAYEYTDEEYRRLLVKKQTEMEKLLSGFAPVDPIVGMENPYYYRNKVCAEFRKLKNGTIISGRYQEGTHNVIETKGCKIEDQRADAIIQDITGLFRSFKMMIYNEDSGYGLIRHVLIRTAHQTGQIMVIIVTASPVFPSKKNFANALLKLHPEITTIVQNINTKDTNMVLGDRNQVIYGKGYIEDVLCGKRFRLSPGSFYQINSVQTEKLYNKAIKYADLWKDLGTWNTLTEEMPENSIGDVTWDDTCENSHAINVLGIPMVVMGAKNMVIAASHDGILVADKHQSSYIKDCLANIADTSKYEERRWGTIKTIDNDEDDGIKSVTKRIKVVAGKKTPESRHLQHTETITVLSGMGKLIMEGVEVDLMAGATVSIAAGKTYSIQALGSDLRCIEISISKSKENA